MQVWVLHSVMTLPGSHLPWISGTGSAWASSLWNPQVVGKPAKGSRHLCILECLVKINNNDLNVLLGNKDKISLLPGVLVLNSFNLCTCVSGNKMQNQFGLAVCHKPLPIRGCSNLFQGKLLLLLETV